MNTPEDFEGSSVEHTDLVSRIISHPKRGDKVGRMKVTAVQGKNVQYVIGVGESKTSHSVSLAVWRYMVRNRR